MKAGDSFWSNVFIYRLAAEDPTQSSAVILNTDGHIGQYNRAHRTLYHFMENVAPVIVALPWTFQIYPFPSFILTCIYCLGRVIYAIGYTAAFSARTPGFAMDRISMWSLVGLCLTAFIYSF